MGIATNNYTAMLFAVAAAVIYGGWAIHANYEHGIHAWAMAGIVQGSYAFISTLTITHVAQYICAKFHYGLRGIAWGFVSSFLVMLSIPLFVHYIAGTPDVWETILPGLIWGSIYLLGVLISSDIKMRSMAKQKSEIE